MIYTPSRGIIMLPSGRVVCTKIKFRGYEISISMEDNCGVTEDLVFTDIKVNNLADDEITSEFIREGTAHDAECLYNIMKQITEKA